jgi:hypothetical protein
LVLRMLKTLFLLGLETFTFIGPLASCPTFLTVIVINEVPQKDSGCILKTTDVLFKKVSLIFFLFFTFCVEKERPK